MLFLIKAAFTKQNSAKQLHFQNSYIFRTATSLTQLLLPNKYFFRTRRFLEWLLLITNSASERYFFRISYLLITYTFMKLALLPSSYFFRCTLICFRRSKFFCYFYLFNHYFRIASSANYARTFL